MEFYRRPNMFISVAWADSIGRRSWSPPVPTLRDVGGTAMRGYDRYWLDYDTVAFAVLMIGLGMVELLAWSI
jgi:hypothetical protein